MKHPDCRYTFAHEKHEHWEGPDEDGVEPTGPVFVCNGMTQSEIDSTDKEEVGDLN